MSVTPTVSPGPSKGVDSPRVGAVKKPTVKRLGATLGKEANLPSEKRENPFLASDVELPAANPEKFKLIHTVKAHDLAVSSYVVACLIGIWMDTNNPLVSSSIPRR